MAAAPQPFDRETIEKAFGRIGELAVAAGKIVEISVYGGSALVLTLEARPATSDVVASPAYLFDMKSLAMRAGGIDEKRDVDDIRLLGEMLGVRNAAQALGIVARYYPAERLPPKTRFGLEEIFGPAGP
jgi:hypothetical protein